MPAGPSLEHPSRITCWTCTLCSSKTKTRQEQSYKRGAFPYSCLTLLPEKNASMMNFNHFLKNLQVISESVSKRLLSLWNYHFVGQEIKDNRLKIPSRSSRQSDGVLEEVWRHFFYCYKSSQFTLAWRELSLFLIPFSFNSPFDSPSIWQVSALFSI